MVQSILYPTPCKTKYRQNKKIRILILLISICPFKINVNPKNSNKARFSVDLSVAVYKNANNLKYLMK